MPAAAGETVKDSAPRKEAWKTGAGSGEVTATRGRQTGGRQGDDHHHGRVAGFPAKTGSKAGMGDPQPRCPAPRSVDAA